MATLEKIRSKSVLLVSIIFVALFLFIITIIDNPLGLFMDQTTVVNVNGKKVDYEQYQKRAQELREQNPQNVNADEDALQALISETLFQQEYDKLGLAVSPEEISQVLVGENAPAYIVNSFRGQFGATPAEVLAAIQNPEALGLTDEQVAMMSKSYKDFEDQIEQFLLGQKFFQLVGGTINANKLDAKTAFDENNTSYRLATVSKSLYSVQDSVTDADIQKYYNEHKESYKLDEPSRYVRYVNLDITPSAADRQAASEAVQQAMDQIAETEGLDALVGNSAFVINRISGDSATIAAERIPALADFVKNGTVGEARVVLNSAFAPVNPRVVIARLMEREVKPTGAQFKQAVLDPSQDADSLVAKLNGLAEVNDSTPGVMQVVEQHFEFAQMPAEVVKQLQEADGKFVALTMSDGTRVATAIKENDKAKPVFTVQTATYNIEPSRETLDALNTRMRDFLIVASTAEAFNQDNAAQQGLAVEDALISNSSTSINGLEDTRGIVAWAMDAKKGEVSRLFTDSKNTHLTAAAVADVYKSDYVPATFPGVRQNIENEALNVKRADKLIGEYTGKGTTLADYQKAMEASRIDTISHVSLGNARYAQLGGLRGAKKGEVVGPLRWNGSVIVYQILDSEEGQMPFDEASNSAQYQRQMQQMLIGNDRVNALLLGKGKIKNRILKFTRQ